MRQKTIFIISVILAILFCINTIHAQNTVKQMFTKSITQAVTTNYDEFKLKKFDEFNQSLHLGSYGTYQLSLKYQDIFSEGYITRKADKTPEKLPLTFRGTIQGSPDTKVTLTANDNFLSGFIDTGSEVIFFEPYNTFDESAAKNELIIYYQKDVIERESTCASNHTDQQAEQIAPQVSNFKSGATGCYEVEMALVADYGMYQKHGSNTLSHIVSVLNNVKTYYDDEFNDEIRFTVVDDYIATSAAMDLWSDTTNASALLSEFRDTTFTDVAYDLASLWVARDIWSYDDEDEENYGVAGRAYRPGVCGSRYNIIEDFNSNIAYLGKLFTHEIGHNFSATHDTLSSNIMSPSINLADSLTWTSQSLNEINTFYPTADCLCASGDAVDLFFGDCGTSSQNGNILNISGLEVFNVSSVLSDSCKIGWYLSTDDNIDTNDYLVFSGDIPPLDVYGIKYVTIFPITNVPPGDYYLGTIIDYENTLAESNEENNIGCVSPSANITIPTTLPDLDITNCGVSFSAGTTRYFQDIRVTNTGGTASDASNVGIFLSTDSDVNTSDYLVAEVDIPAMSPGSFTLRDLSFDTADALGVPPGNYYIGVVADTDNDIMEDDEENNTGCVSPSANITISTTPPDLDITCSTPYAVGTDYYLDISVSNIGGTASDQATIGVYLSVDNNIDTSDYSLAIIDIFALNPDASSLVQFSVNAADLPDVPPGNYYIGVIADIYDNVTESNETNNSCTSVSASVTVCPGASGAPCDDGNDCTANDIYDDDCVCTGTPIPYCGTCRYTDSLALVALYNSTDGANWTETWDLTQPLTAWEGIYLQEGCIIVVDLSGNSLNGSLPEEIGDMSNLQFLDLDYNNLSGSIPNSIGNLSELIFLRLRDNDLSGNIPSSIGGMTNLRRLWLYNNDLSGSIPPEIDSLDNLELLQLSFNNLTGDIPPEIGGMENIRGIYMDVNNLSGAIPTTLGDITTLEALSLSSNSLTDTIPSELGMLENLTYLSLHSNDLEGNIPAELGNISGLRELYLSNNALTGSIPSELGSISTLTSLRLNDNDLSGCYDANLSNWCTQFSIGSNTDSAINAGNPGLSSWEDFCNTNAGSCNLFGECRLRDSTTLVKFYNSTNGANWNTKWDLTKPIDTWHGITLNAYGCVESIVIGNNNLTGTLPASIGDLSELKMLGLGGNEMSDTIPAQIANLHQLINLGLGNNNFTGGIPPQIGSMTNLEQLWLAGNINLGGSIPPEFGQLANLTHLVLNNCGLAGGLPKELEGQTNIYYWRLFDNDLSGCYPPELAVICSRLRPGFNGNDKVSDGNNLSSWEDFCASQNGVCQAAPKIGDAYISDYNIYPNPTESGTALQLKFNSHTDSENATLSIYNLTGQLVQSENLTIQNGENHFTTPLKNYAAGIYFVKLQSGTYVGTQKLVIQ